METDKDYIKRQLKDVYDLEVDDNQLEFVKGKVSNEEKKEHPVWTELREIVEQLQELDNRKVNSFIDLYCEKEKAELTTLFKEEFKDIPDDDPLKKEVLLLLGYLGIMIMKDDKYTDEDVENAINELLEEL